LSGGHWANQDQQAFETLGQLDLSKLLKVIQECFREVDLAESGDTSKAEGAKHVYELLLEYGDEVWGR